ncbi:MAG TPA: type IV pilus modification protein PilV [Rhodanobacteraceae bacterium]|jgi:type IV pilus assembly protein PilV
MIRFASPRGARGVSMIEVLVAIVIFSLGLLGLALMQLKGASFTKDSGARSAAVLLARSLADRMQANPQGVTDGDYVWTGGTPPTYTDCSSAACTPAQVANNDLNAWLSQMQASLPASASTAAVGQVLSNGDGTYTISVQWNGQGIAGQSSESDSFVFVPRAGG